MAMSPTSLINPDPLYRMAEKIETERKSQQCTVIYKYMLTELGKPIVMSMPVGTKLLSAQLQDGVIRLWALHPFTRAGERKFEKRTLFITGTGHETEFAVDSMRFISTVQVGPLVWHVFEIINIGEF